MIMQKVKNNKARSFYAIMVAKYGWSQGLLREKIEFNEYQKCLTSQNNFEKTVDEAQIDQTRWQFKDEYNLDFLTLKGNFIERELENCLVDNIVKFLAEMGGDFCFVGRQFRVEIGEDEFFIDLLFYNRKLKSLIAIELKAGKFKFDYIGQMGGYLAALDARVKNNDENPSIGIIVCKEKNKAVVEYALSSTNKPIGVATFKYNDLPKRISKYLPNEEDLKKRLIE